MTVQSVKIKTDVSIEYTESNQQAGKEDRLKLVSLEEPRPELREAMESLAPHVCEILEWDPDYVDGLTIQAVKIERKGEKKLYQIAGHKALAESGTTFKFITPPRPDSVDEGKEAFALSSDAVAVLKQLENEALRYLKGERSQAMLPFDEETE